VKISISVFFDHATLIFLRENQKIRFESFAPEEVHRE